MSRFTLIGVDGNAFSVMGYTERALRKAGLQDRVDKMYEEAESGDYYHLLMICDSYVQMANEALGLTDEDEEEF